ncbi:uncharacterized protein LOC144452596 isoform X2 [Glandiceps talaboti]
MESVFRVPSVPSMRMPKGHRRRRRRRSRDETRKRSSSSQSSVEITATATSPHGGPTIIATATAPVNSRSERESAAVAMATILAKELQPEHKLPSKEVTVRPKPDFLALLSAVGAKGQIFTTRQVLSHLITYIGSRQLYDQLDPRKVYCENDALGKVFGVKEFTIKDVKNLLFENVIIVSNPAHLAVQHHPGYQHQQRQSYYTLQHHHEQMVVRTTATCTTSMTSASSTKPDSTASVSMATSISMPAPTVMIDAGVSTTSNVVSMETKPVSPSGSSLTSPPSKENTRDKETVSSEYTATSCSVQGRETAVVADSSDDLWFLEEDGHFSVEYEVESDASEGYSFGNDTSETVDSDASIEEVYEVLQLCDEDDNDSCFADDDSSDSDTELTDQDKWTCTECSTLNSPIRRYCIRCWALRKGWLPDTEKLAQLRNIREKRKLQRSISAPDAILHQSSSTVASSNSQATSFQDGVPVMNLTNSMYAVTVTGGDEPDIGIPKQPIIPLQPVSTSDDKSSGKGDDFPDSSPSHAEGRYSSNAHIDTAIGQREIRLSEDEAGLWPHFAHNALPAQQKAINLTMRSGIGQDIPDTDPNDIDKASIVYAVFGKGDVPDTDPADVPHSPGTGSGSTPGPAVTHCVKRSLTMESSPERLPLKKRKTSRDSLSPEKDKSEAVVFDSPANGHRMCNTPGYSSAPGFDQPDVGNGHSHSESHAVPEKSRGGLEAVRDSPSQPPLRRETSQSTMSPPSEGESYSQHAVGYSLRNTPPKRIRLEERGDSGIHLSSSSTLRSESATHGMSRSPEHLSPRLTSPVTSQSKRPDLSPLTPKPSTSHESPSEHASQSSSQQSDSRAFSDLCMICLTRPKTASIIHGRTGHQVCCYSCAKKLRRHGKPCPVCRRPIQLVIKNFLV